MSWELVSWVKDWDIELLRLWIWIELMNFVNCLCFDGNEFSCLNGWLRCGKPWEKMRLKAYAELWNEKLGNVKLYQMIEMKKMPKKGNIKMKKMPRKGK